VLERLLRRNRRGDRSVEADADAAPPKDTRPSIGIALSGGAARGFAHIGVLQTLLAHGLKPEIVVGTSMGAVIGGCYAAGQLEATAEWARSLTRRRMLGLSRRQPRRIRPHQRHAPSPTTRKDHRQDQDRGA
jgi:NTE family protein